MKTLAKSHVQRVEEIEDTMIRRVRRFLGFKIPYWERVSSQHIGNDIVIEADRPIRAVYLNGKEIIIDSPSH